MWLLSVRGSALRQLRSGEDSARLRGPPLLRRHSHGGADCSVLHHQLCALLDGIAVLVLKQRHLVQGVFEGGGHFCQIRVRALQLPFPTFFYLQIE